MGDDDHALYLLASDATDRSTFATNWTDLTDTGNTTLHVHDIYVRKDDFTQNSGVLVGTGAGAYAEETGATLRTSLGLAIGTNVLAEQTIGIADNNLLEVDDATAADDEFCRFTTTGIEGLSKALTLAALNVADGADVTGSNAPQAHTTSHTDGSDDIQTATTAQKGVVSELATAIEANAGTDSSRVVTPSVLPILFQDSKYTFAADAEASDTYAITLTPAIGAYATGQVFTFSANTANTGEATLNVNAKGAKTIKKMHDQDLATGDIESGQMVTVVYDGTNMQMVSQVASTPAAGLTVTGFYAGSNSFTDHSTGTWETVDMKDEEWDPDGEYDAVTNSDYTPTTAGTYVFLACVQLEEGIDEGDYYGMALYKNGVQKSVIGLTTGGSAAVQLAIGGACVIEVAANDVYDLRVYHDYIGGDNKRKTRNNIATTWWAAYIIKEA